MMNDQLASSSYPIYGKSGTSDWGIYGLEYGIPQAAIRDEWSVGYSSAYTVACWSGYLTQYEQQGYYIPVNQIIYYNMAFEITDYLLDYMSSREQYVDIPRQMESLIIKVVISRLNLLARRSRYIFNR